MALDSLRDGFIRLCFDTSLNAYPNGRRVLLEGQFYNPGLGCTVVPDQLIKITSLRQIDCQFGAGSVLAESMKIAFGCCPNNAMEFYALPRADAAGAVKAVYTMTFTGPATSDGRIDIYWGDAQWNISVRITSGMTAAQIATAIQAAVPATFPYVATVAAGVVTLTARNGGTVGNYLNPQVHWHERANYFPTGVTVTMAQTVVGSVDPAPLTYANILGECCYCSFAMLYGDSPWQDGAIAYLDDAWSCLKPQCFGHGYTYSAGTLGQILAQDRNKETVSLLAHCNSDPNFPWLKVAAYAAHSCCTTVDNPEIAVQGPQYGVLSCLRFPESCTQCFTFDEQNQLRDSGFVVTVPLVGGTGALTNPMISNDVTNNRRDADGRVNLTFRDVSARRLAASTAQAFAEKLQEYNGLGLFTKNTDIRVGVRGTNPRLILGGIRSWAKDNVGVLFSEFDNIDEDIKLLTDFEVAPQCQGIPGKLYANMVYRPPVRITQIVANLKPKLLDNCN